MSHQVDVKTQIKNLDVLKDAIIELGYSCTSNGVMFDYLGKKVGKVDVLVSVKGFPNRVGFKLGADGNYSIVGDFYGLPIKEKKFTDNVMQSYASLQVKALLQKKRYNIVSQNTETDGSIKIVARSIAA